MNTSMKRSLAQRRRIERLGYLHCAICGKETKRKNAYQKFCPECRKSYAKMEAYRNEQSMKLLAQEERKKQKILSLESVTKICHEQRIKYTDWSTAEYMSKTMTGIKTLLLREVNIKRFLDSSEIIIKVKGESPTDTYKELLKRLNPFLGKAVIFTDLQNVYLVKKY